MKIPQFYGLSLPKLFIIALFFALRFATAMERPPWAGFYANCKNDPIDSVRFPFIKGEADRVKWADMEPKPGVYDWSQMDSHIGNAVKGNYYYYFVLWTGPNAPEWIYEKGVPKVTVSGGKGKETFPY